MDLTKHAPLFLVVIAMAAALILVKVAVHAFGLEFLTLDTLFSSVVAATIFIIGFLLSSILQDYKEAERLPAEIRSTMEGIHDDVACFWQDDPKADLPHLRSTLLGILRGLETGLGNEGHHSHLEAAMASADALGPYFSQLERAGMPVNHIIRLRNGLDILRKCLYRISYIQKIEFVPSVHVLIQTLVTAVLFMLLFLRTNGGYGSALVFGFVSFLFVFALHLVSVFEQPFREGVHTPDKVDLYLLRDFAQKLERLDATGSQSRPEAARLRA